MPIPLPHSLAADPNSTFLRKGAIMRTAFIIAIVIASLQFTGCSNDSNNVLVGQDQGQTIDVTVIGNNGTAATGVPVVLGDSNGAMKTSGTTDGSGKIIFTGAPANATITAANTCLYSGATTTTHSIAIRYDVNGPVQLSVDTCPDVAVVPPIGEPIPLGTVTVNIKNIASKVTENAIYAGRAYTYPSISLITQKTYTIYSSDLNNDGKISFVTIGYDTAHEATTYGMLLDQTFSDKMTVDLSLNQSLGHVRYDITNIPAETIDLRTNVFHSKGWGEYIGLGRSAGLASYPSSTSITVPYIPDYASYLSYDVEVVLDYNQNGRGEASQFLSLVPSTGAPAVQVFDMSQALNAPHGLTVSNEGTATPTLSWSGTDARTTNLNVGASFRRFSGDYMDFFFFDLTNGRTSFTFPELPDSLAAFRPSSVEFFMVFYNSYALYSTSWGTYSKNVSMKPQMEAFRADFETAARRKGQQVKPLAAVR